MTKLRIESRRLTGHSLSRLLLIALFLSTPSLVVRADGGVVLWQQTTGPFTVTLFSTELPLRPGPADISVLVERPGGHSPVMDARVFIELENEGGMTVNAEATHDQARNKLLYCSLLNLPAAGRWKMRLNVSRGGERAEASGDLNVAEPRPALLPYWELVSFPPVVMILFLINQCLRNRRTAHGSHSLNDGVSLKTRR